MQYYLGIDAGSSSLKLAIIDKNKKLINSVYLKNYGLIETLKEGFKKIKQNNYKIKGVGCTGSGRSFVKLLIGGDIEKSEIIAHGIASLFYYPDAKTICDIGAEDSKIIIMDNGITNFVMNTICSAGCGAMLESIAARIGVNIEEVGDLALQSKNQINIPSKCGIFATSSVVTMLNKGIDKKDILMGVCRGLINNYLLLTKNIDLKSPIIFQGMTAKNKALVKALEEQLNKKIIVPPNCEFMGAIGIAIISMENKIKKTNFKGFDFIDENLKTEFYNCKNCINNCEITQILKDKKIIGKIGNKCGL